MTWTEVVYVVAGIALPAYYVPQMLKCVADNTQLAAYSMSKAATQLALRAAMLPFVFGIDNATMTSVVALDFVGRAAEFGAAVWSLSRQGLAAPQILQRCVPAANRLVALRSGRDVAAQTPAVMLPDSGTADLAPAAQSAAIATAPAAHPGFAPLCATPLQEERHHEPNLITFSSGQPPERRRGRRGVDRVRRRGR